MKRRLSHILIGSIMLLASVAFFQAATPTQGATGIPKVLNYQGRLYDNAGNLLGGSGTTYCFRFSIYDASTAGAKLWPTGAPSTMTGTVQNGFFNIGVGDASIGGDVLDFNFQDNDTTFLNVEVATTTGSCGPFQTLLPRQRITAAGYAINAAAVGGYTAAQNASGNQIPVLASGNLTLAGTNPQLNATGTNTLTLQGGTGTGHIQFFNASNFITATGTAAFAGNLSIGGTTDLQGFTFTSATGTGNFTINTINALAGSELQTLTFTSATGTSISAEFAAFQTTTILHSLNIGAEAQLSNAPLQITGDIDTYLQVNLHNHSSGTTASSDYVATADNGDDSSYYVDLGINSSNYNQEAYGITRANDAYLLASTKGLVIGTAGTSTDAHLIFHTGGTASTSARLSISNTGIVKVGNSSVPGTETGLFVLDAKLDTGDPTGQPGAMYYNSSSLRFRCFQRDTWTNCVPGTDYAPSIIERRWGYLRPLGTTATTFTSVGLVAHVVNGTAAASSSDEDYYIRYSTAAATNSVAGLTQAFTQTQARYRPILSTRIRTNTTITSTRIWIALSTASMTSTDGVGALATRYVGIRYSTAASDTNWQCASGDGTTGSVQDTGILVSPNMYYDMKVDWSVDGQLSCSITTSTAANASPNITVKTTNLDTTQTANLGFTNALSNLAGVVRIHRLSYIYIEDKN